MEALDNGNDQSWAVRVGPFQRCVSQLAHALHGVSYSFCFFARLRTTLGRGGPGSRAMKTVVMDELPTLQVKTEEELDAAVKVATTEKADKCVSEMNRPVARHSPSLADDFLYCPC